MFSAIADQLKRFHKFETSSSLGAKVVAQMKYSPYLDDKTHLSSFEVSEWSFYVSKMALDGTYGDHIVLTVLAKICDVQLKICSTLGEGATRIITPSGSDVLLDSHPTLYLGHRAYLDARRCEEEHYFSLNVSDVSTSVHVAASSIVASALEEHSICEDSDRGEDGFKFVGRRQSSDLSGIPMTDDCRSKTLVADPDTSITRTENGSGDHNVDVITNDVERNMMSDPCFATIAFSAVL